MKQQEKLLTINASLQMVVKMKGEENVAKVWWIIIKGLMLETLAAVFLKLTQHRYRVNNVTLTKLQL